MAIWLIGPSCRIGCQPTGHTPPMSSPTYPHLRRVLVKAPPSLSLTPLLSGLFAGTGAPQHPHGNCEYGNHIVNDETPRNCAVSLRNQVHKSQWRQ